MKTYKTPSFNPVNIQKCYEKSSQVNNHKLVFGGRPYKEGWLEMIFKKKTKKKTTQTSKLGFLKEKNFRKNTSVGTGSMGKEVAERYV